MSKRTSRVQIRWIIWALAAIFYFYEYLLRISPSVMIPELMQTYHVDAAAIGFMVAFYLYAYAPMQLVVGVLMDQYGAKKLLTLASIICGLGSILFGLSNHIVLAGIGRLLIGLGSAFAFVGMVFICSHLFPQHKRALVIGL
ncbi:MAG: MFS transporter, partial [Chlamydiales bacterium]|nr:MFS transporter [Chlamydiales bacterium]